ncbi:hypothetical protein K4K57_000820 [Colletotrichum sp. SAR 10_99]|nr:hypothetical protein K4K57_000820 [Colletotrichum sp. SAR 10_99]
MDAVTIASYVTNVNNSLQNTKYHSALEDLHRAEEEKWTAQINSERAHSISMAHNAQLADLRAERDAAEVALKQIIVCLQACEERLERAQRRVKKAWLDKAEIDEEANKTHRYLSRSTPYFRSAVNILKWQMQQPEGNGGEPDLEKLEAASVSERIVKSSEVEYLEETVPQDCEEECAEAKELLRKDKGGNKGANEGNGY